MSYSKWLVKMAVVLICGAALLVPDVISWGDDDFYVVGGGSPWRRNGTSIYYTAGNVGIGTDNPGHSLHIDSNTSEPMYATSAGTGATVISGISYAASGPGWGVFGRSYSADSASAYGVYGSATGLGSGVRGSNDTNTGYGVKGDNSAAGGIGIYGLSSATSGNGCGVFGESKSLLNYIPNAGVHGKSAGGAGVYGEGGNIGCGVYGQGYIGVYCDGPFIATGTKNAIVPTSQGQRNLYCQESPEVWFEDFGEGQLADGRARINLDQLFLETVTINDKNPLKVFIQLNDDCNGVYVQRQATGFEVKELRAGTSNARFTYLVVAKRKGLETARLEGAPDTPKTAALPVPLKVAQK